MCAAFASCAVPAAAMTWLLLPAACLGGCPAIPEGSWDAAPSFSDSVPPEYHMARMAGLQGLVQVVIVVLESGAPCEVKVVSSPSVPLSRSASEAARLSRYHPATKDGRAVPGIMNVTYRFSLTEPPRRRTNWPPADLREPRVSSVASAEPATSPGGVPYTAYRYGTVEIRGDISTALCDSVLAVVRGRLQPGEAVFRLTHYLALPRDWDPEYGATWRQVGDLAVDVRRSGAGWRTYRFLNRNGTYELSDTQSIMRID